MKTGYKVLIGIGALYGGALAVNFYSTRKFAVQRALSLSKDKGIINIGSGCDWSGSAMSFCNLPQVKVNLDIHIADNCPKCQYANLEEAPLPFADGQFDVALASHSLEHIDNWQAALTEWARIADHVVIVLPNPMGIDFFRMNPLHLQHFSFADMRSIRQNWPTVEVYC